MAETNKSPYFNDFNEKVNDKQVLYVAGRPVQARELNNQQSIFLNQQKLFADHMFKNGSRISGASVSTITREYVRADTIVRTPGLRNVRIIGKSSGVEALLYDLRYEELTTRCTMVVEYTKTGIDAVQYRFVPGEELELRDLETDGLLTTGTVRCPTCPGYIDPQDTILPVARATSYIVVDEGVMYYDGFFINVPRSEIIYSLHGEPVTCKIGFDVIEEIVTAEDDATLYDNALGYPNETAPGADRLRVKLNLVMRSNNPGSGSKFIELATIEEGYLQVLNSDYQYAAIMDTMAKRTWEESGNYTVNEWRVRYREHKAAYKGDPNGFILNGDENLLNVLIGSGIGYVKGYRIETPEGKFINVNKARSTLKAYDGALYFNQGAYVDLVPDTTMSVWPNNPASPSTLDLSNVQLYDAAPLRNAPSGNIIGSMKLGDAVYMGENASGQKVWRYKVIEYIMNSKTKKVMAVANETNRFLAVPETGKEFLVINQEQIPRSLVFQTPKQHVKSLRNLDRPDRSSMTIVLRKKLTATLDQNGSYTFTLVSQTFDSNITNTVIIVGGAGRHETVYATPQNCKPAGNSLTLELGSAHNNKTVTIIHSVSTVGLVEKVKTSMTANKNSIPRVNWDSPIKLGKADVYRLEKVEAYASSSPDTKEDVTNKFTLHQNITDYAYNESHIELISDDISNAFDTIDIKFRYFEHSDSNNAGYFTVDSYKSAIEDQDSGITYANLPTYVVGSARLSASSIVDFRPIRLESGTVQGEIPASNETAYFNIEYYAPRRDLLCVDKEGIFFHMQGVPADSPKAPINRNADVMPLYEVLIPAYTYSFADVKVNKIENKRYTMRDIGRLEARIENLEYYTTLSQLESSAAADSTRDGNGFDRYKNGFAVDDFKKFGTGDVVSDEYRCTYDKERGELRPDYFMFNRKGTINLAKSINAAIYSGVVMKPYTHELALEQPFATRSVSVTPYLVYQRKGGLMLSPNIDNWADTERVPDMTFNIDTGVEAARAMVNKTNQIKTAFNDWVFANSNIEVGDNDTVAFGVDATLTRKTDVDVTTSTRTETTVIQNASISSGAMGSGRGSRLVETIGDIRETNVIRDTNTVTTVTDTRNYSLDGIDSRTDHYTFDRVTDVLLQPYMRPVNIELVASGLTPNTRHWVFFDNINVTGQSVLIGHSDKIKNAVTANMLISDSEGNLSAMLNIREGQFFTGVKNVRITNDPNNTGQPENETSYATAQFFAGGLKQQKQNLTLAVTTPVYVESASNVSASSTSTTVATTSTVVSTDRLVTNIRRIPIWRGFDSGGGDGPDGDPIAQSFLVKHDAMVSRISLWFEAIADDVEVQIRDMVNGYPGTTILGKTKKKSTNIETSFDASVKTNFDFDVPVRVEANKEYCFVILGNVPASRIWISRLGETCVNHPNKVADTQLTLGSCFRSQNNTTWNAEQYDDIMYELYVAKFDATPMVATFDIRGGMEPDPLDQVPFEAERGSKFIRVYCKNDHGLKVGDKVSIQLYSDEYYDIALTNGYVVQGHHLEIDNQRSTAKVKSILYADPLHATVQLEGLTGAITPSSSFMATAYLAKPGKQDAYRAYFDIDVADYDIRQAAGTFVNVKVPQQLNGIPLAELNTQHQVKRVDDNKTFIIEVDSKAAESGRFGPSGGLVIFNRKYEIMNISANYQNHGCEEEWTASAYSYGATGGIWEGTNYQKIEDFKFDMKANRYLSQPAIMATAVNEKEKMSNEPSLRVSGKFTLNNPYLSPVIYDESFSGTFISNDLYMISEAAMNQEPNESGRFKPETDRGQGSERYKYVTNTIAIKNPAADLKIWFDIYKPAYSDFDVYVKLLKSEMTNIDDQEWTMLPGIDKSPISANASDTIEYDLLMSQYLPTIAGADNMFSAFKVKLVARTKNSANPPMFKNLRMIAYT